MALYRVICPHLKKLISKLKYEIKKSFSLTIDFFKVSHYNKLIE